MHQLHGDSVGDLQQQPPGRGLRDSALRQTRRASPFTNCTVAHSELLTKSHPSGPRKVARLRGALRGQAARRGGVSAGRLAEV